jgi:hypothetical protein
MDGVYDPSNNGYLHLENIHGVPGSPITIKALNERQAWLRGDAWNNTIDIRNSSYVVLDGLRVSSMDNSAARQGDNPIDIRWSDHVALKHLLVHNTNRYTNSHLITCSQVSDSLVEDTELYFFHRHGIGVYDSNDNTFRRIYANSRDYSDVPGGWPSGNPNGGDVAISIYPGSNNLVENLISDGNQTAFDVQATARSDNNRFLGVISLNGYYGAIVTARGDSDAEMPHNTLIRDFLAVNPQVVGLFARSADSTRFEQSAVVGAGGDGVVADKNPGAMGSGNYSFYAENSLVVASGSSGFEIVPDITTYRLESVDSYANALNYQPQSGSNLINAISIDPNLGSSVLAIPTNSPLKGAGVGGLDIGPNLLNRYQDGVLTNSPLWDPSSGQFLSGAIVKGLNDVPGASAFDVHTRLNTA